MDLERIYQEYFTIVYGYVLSLSRDPAIAEDLTQETFFRAMKNLDDFRGDCAVQTWLCQIAKNLYFKHADKKARRKRIDHAQRVQEHIDGDFGEILVQKEYSSRIYRILHKMKDPYKEVFMLRLFGEISFREIGELFEKNETWARVTYHRARKMIREVLDHEDKL